jgi:hypothetical protein
VRLVDPNLDLHIAISPPNLRSSFLAENKGVLLILPQVPNWQVCNHTPEMRNGLPTPRLLQALQNPIQPQRKRPPTGSGASFKNR